MIVDWLRRDGGIRPRQQRPTNVIGPRTGITAPSDRTARDEHRDRLAADLAEYLARGGRIETLPGPQDGKTRRAHHGGVFGL